MDNSNSSSNSMTSSTVSSESALRSLIKCVSRVISLLSTPICSLTISITFCSMSSIIVSCPDSLSYPWVTVTPRPQTIAVPLLFATAGASSHNHPPIHTNHLSGHVTGALGCQECDHRRDLIRLTESLEWNQRLGAFLDLVVQDVGHVRHDEARR